MARPKRVPNQKTAYERLTDAFWESLDKKPLEDISVTDISKQAEVNHNTFYYYFDNTDDMALKILQESYPSTAYVAAVIRNAQMISSGSLQPASGFENGAPTENVQNIATIFAESQIKKVCKLINSAHPTIQEELRTNGVCMWAEAVGLNPNILSQEDRQMVIFVIGGVLELIREQGGSCEQDLANLFTQPAGKTALQLLDGVKNKYMR